MTGLHHVITELAGIDGMRSFRVRRSDQKRGATVLYDGVKAYCGSCKGITHAMQRNCAHTRATLRHIWASREDVTIP